MSCHILIIDDDASFRHLLKRRLQSFISEVNFTNFENLADTRAFIAANTVSSFDLVILDQHLPDGKGVELLSEGTFKDLAVLSVSSDDAPEIPGATVQAGAAYFLNKMDISAPLFEPLVQGIIDRNKLNHELMKAKVDAVVIDTIKTLVGTLQHEINNPLGVVLGAAYLLKCSETATQEQKEAAALVESSGERIKHVLQQLSQAIQFESVTKANQKVFQIPGDKPWEDD